VIPVIVTDGKPPVVAQQSSLNKRSAIQGKLNPTPIITIVPKASLIDIRDAWHRMTQFPDGAALGQATSWIKCGIEPSGHFKPYHTPRPRPCC